MKNILNLDFKDYKNTSQFLEFYYSVNNMDNNERQFLLSKSLETGNFFIFNLLEIEDKNPYFQLLFSSLKTLKKSLNIKIKIISNNDIETLEKFNFFVNKFENISLYNWEELEKYFHVLMYYNELIENLQTLETSSI